MTASDFSHRSLLSPPSPLGLAFGSLAFMASLTPSLIPRTGMLQGGIAGLAFMSLYGLAVGAVFLWRWLGLPEPQQSTRRAARILLHGLSLALIAFGLAMATSWQNSIHETMGIPSVESARPFTIALAGLVVILVVLMLSRLFHRSVIVIATRLAYVVPRRVALLGGFVATAVLSWFIGSGLLGEGALRALDSSYRKVDLYIPAEFTQPTAPQMTGSAASLIPWDSLGAQGRNRIMAAPTKAEIATLAGAEAMEPLRVYVGLNSADNAEERAALALAELIRIGAFDRSMLVIATPTGTGWIDPASMAPLEILQRGDIASVSVQYSYLPSWLTLLVDPEYGGETARAVFAAIYGHWRGLPPTARPRLFLFGLSLGAFNSDLSSDMFDIIADPYDGALWAGPPFPSHTWRRATAARNEGSPAWLPVFRDSSLLRFMNQNGVAPAADKPGWGPVRILYLQYASDPITFFETEILWRRPSWLESPRGPDVSPELRWIPIVTFLQILCDVMTATTTPRGVGHVIAADHYMSGWMAVAEPDGWSEERLAAVRQWFAERGL
jgi:uncharacterized membrane protein